MWVFHPLRRNYLPARATDAALQGLTEYQWRVVRRAVRERFDAPDHVLSLAAARNAIRDVVEATVTKPSRQRRVRAARYLGTLDDRIQTLPDKSSGALSIDPSVSPDDVDFAPESEPPPSPAECLTDGDHSDDEFNIDDWDVAV